MKYKILVDKKKRFLFKKNELKNISIKIGIRLNQRLNVNSFIKPFEKNAVLTKINNRCFVSSRSKGVYRKFKVSRLKFRDILLNGNYPGFKKNCW